MIWLLLLTFMAASAALLTHYNKEEHLFPVLLVPCSTEAGVAVFLSTQTQSEEVFQASL